MLVLKRCYFLHQLQFQFIDDDAPPVTMPSSVRERPASAIEFFSTSDMDALFPASAEKSPLVQRKKSSDPKLMERLAALAFDMRLTNRNKQKTNEEQKPLLSEASKGLFFWGSEVICFEK